MKWIPTRGALYVASVFSSVSLEEVARAVPSGVKWFQTHIFKDRDLTRYSNIVRMCTVSTDTR